MESFLQFFINIGDLKEMKRKSWVLSGVKSPETVASHTFRVAIMAWFFSKKKKNLNLEKVLKLALIHDLCEVYAGDMTPYDSVIPKDKKRLEKLRKAWPRFSNVKKIEIALKKYKKEWQSLVKLTAGLPISAKEEIVNLWFDYEGRLTKEARFVRQIDRLEIFLQALQYFKANKSFSIKPWWVYIKERLDDPILVDFLEILDKEFHPKK